jgi:hypothetical protein
MRWKRSIIKGSAVAAVVLVTVAVAPTAAQAYDPNDPNDSGSANNASVVNSYDLHLYDDQNQPVIAHYQNWYSWSCITNWALVWWSGTGDLKVTGSQLYASNFTAHQYQCWPTDCGQS